MDLVAYLYDGRLAALMQAGTDFLRSTDNAFTRALQDHIDRQVALQASGVATTSGYARGVLRLLARYGMRGFEPGALAIR
jgi:hypothetical protein